MASVISSYRHFRQAIVILPSGPVVTHMPQLRPYFSQTPFPGVQASVQPTPPLFEGSLPPVIPLRFSLESFFKCLINKI